MYQSIYHVLLASSNNYFCTLLTPYTNEGELFLLLITSLIYSISICVRSPSDKLWNGYGVIGWIRKEILWADLLKKRNITPKPIKCQYVDITKSNEIYCCILVVGLWIGWNSLHVCCVVYTRRSVTRRPILMLGVIAFLSAALHGVILQI